MHQDFVRGTPQQQQRKTVLVAVVGLVVMVVVVLVVRGLTAVVGSDDGMHLAIDTANVAPGVKPGAEVILRGAQVGTITAVTRTSDGEVEVAVELQPDRVRGLTDNVDVDFRPANYFGVTALNLTERTGGAALRTGVRLHRPTIGDYTMSTMIERGSIVVSGTLSQDMVDTLDKVLTYTDGLTPLIRSGLIFADQVAKTQKAMPTELFGRTDDILAVLPGFLDQTMQGAYTAFSGKFNQRPDGSMGINDRELNNANEGLQNASGALFSAVGTLLRSHAGELTPAVEIIRLFAEPIPGMVGDNIIGPRLRQMVARLNAAFTAPDGTPGLQLRVVMDRLPGIAAPMGLGGLVTAGRP